MQPKMEKDTTPPCQRAVRMSCTCMRGMYVGEACECHVVGRGAVTDNSDEWDTRYVGGIL